MRTGYIHHFSHVSHCEINAAYEAMFDEDPLKAIECLNRLKKFLNETIRDCKEACNNDTSNGVAGCVGDDRTVSDS